MKNLHKDLFSACSSNDIAAVKRLIRSGADVNAVLTLPHHGNTTPLNIAASKGLCHLIDLLVGAGAEFIVEQQGEVLSSLHVATRHDRGDTVKKLLSRGAQVDVRDAWFRTPLHIACWYCCDQSAEILLNSGASPNAPDIDGLTPLHFAAQQGSVSIMRSLVFAGANVNAKTSGELTPAMFVPEIGDRESMRFLASCGANLDGVNLSDAVFYDELKSISESARLKKSTADRSVFSGDESLGL